MSPPPFIRLATCCSLVKRYSWNILRWNSTVRSLAYATCSDVSDASSDTRHQFEKLIGKFKFINESLDRLKREGDSEALLFIGQLKESGLKHDLETYMAVVRLLCHWNSGDNFLKDFIKNNKEWEVESYKISDDLFEALMEEKLIKAVEVLVEVYARAGRFEEAIHALSEMKSRSGLMVSTQTCNLVLNMLIEWEKLDILESVYTQLKRDGLIPNVYTYGALIDGHCRRGCLQEAWQVFAQMEEAGIVPDDFIYGRYIHGLCLNGKTDLAYQVVKNLRESNKKPVASFAYACVIQGFLKESRLQDAEDVFLEMKINKQVVPDAHCYGVLVARYCKEGDTVKASDLCKEMESSGYIETDHVVVRLMIRSLCASGMLDEAVYMFKRFMQQSTPRLFLDGALFNIAIEAACKLGKMDDVMGLVEEMKRRKIKPVVVMQQALGLKPTRKITHA